MIATARASAKTTPYLFDPRMVLSEMGGRLLTPSVGGGPQGLDYRDVESFAGAAIAIANPIQIKTAITRRIPPYPVHKPIPRTKRGSTIPYIAYQTPPRLSNPRGCRAMRQITIPRGTKIVTAAQNPPFQPRSAASWYTHTAMPTGNVNTYTRPVRKGPRVRS